MPLTVSDILHNADLFKAAYPCWPHPAPEETAMTTLEFTGDGRILARDGDGDPVQVGTIAREEPRPDEADRLWHALLWATAGVPGEFGRLDGKIASQRYGQNAEQCERRVRARLAEYGPWWTAKEATS